MKLIDLNERFARSLVAGVFASVILLSLNLFSYYILHVSKRRFINYSALIIFGRQFHSFGEALFSAIAQIGFAAGLIVIFSYLVLKEKRENRLMRGLFTGISCWFTIMVFAYVQGMHKLLPMDIGSGISFLVTSAIWGVTGAWVLYTLDKQYGKVETQSESKQNISRRKKYFLAPAPVNKIAPRETSKPKKIK